MDNKIFERSLIIQNAKERWDSKTESEKKHSAKKYRFIQGGNVDWVKQYDDLNYWQKSILIKGQLIRNYDELPNKVKTHIMKDFGLSTFASKWYKLPSSDKKILLNSVLRNNE